MAGCIFAAVAFYLKVHPNMEPYGFWFLILIIMWRWYILVWIRSMKWVLRQFQHLQ